ncbi:hypothetical protein ACRBEV_26955 [Methylobacterium phyllosphaerae]
MWIYIPDPDEKEPWIGQVKRGITANSSWRFEFVRIVDPEDLYRQAPFEGANNVIGLLDHQKPCTLIRPIVERVDPGKLDIKNKSQRTIITGIFQALLSDIPAEDGDEQKFLGLRFGSDSLDAWYGAPTFERDFDSTTKTPAIDIKPREITNFTVDGLGQVTIARAALITDKIRSSSLQSATTFKVEFDKPRSINQLMSLAFGLERLFGFLIGFRGRYPIFSTWISSKITAGDLEYNYDGTLEIGNLDWTEGETPDRFSCVHGDGLPGADLPAILSQFLSQEKEMVDRIHAVEFGRFFSRNLNDRFAVMMPVLESYVQARYKTGEEESYIEAQDEFFAWIDKSPSHAVREFPKKHVSLKNKKAPSLKTLLTRAIETVNAKGFAFNPELAGRIQDRRGALFHAAPQMDKDEALSFALEVRAITGLLLLHILEDLGIDVAYLAHRYHALGDMRPFMKAPERGPTAPDLGQDTAGTTRTAT